MAKTTIQKKHITLARNEARAKSTARIDGRSIFIKRYPGNNYRIILVHVTEKQRAARDMFADANALAKDDMKRWNRARHWRRYAHKHHISRAYRAAVSFYYKLILKHSEELLEVFHEKHSDRIDNRLVRGSKPIEKQYKSTNENEDMRLFRDKSQFFWVKFDTIEEYKESLFLLAS